MRIETAGGGGSGAVDSVFGRSGAVTAADGDYYGVVAAAQTGAVQASRYVGATNSGAPASGTFAVGDFVIDRSGHVHLCVTAGTPGTWRNISKSREMLTATGRGILAETWNLANVNRNSAPTGAGASNGTLFLTSIGLRAGETITNLGAAVGANGTALTFVKLGLFSKTGTFLRATVEGSASFNAGTSPRMQQLALTTPYVVPADDLYYIGFLQYGLGATGCLIAEATNIQSAGTAFPGGPRMMTKVQNQIDISANVSPTTDGDHCYYFFAS